MTDTAPSILDAFGATFLRTHQLLEDVGDSQWKPGRTPTLPEDTTERSKGLTSDPVVTAALDTRRIRLRDAVISAESAMADALTALAHAEAVLSKALGTGSPEASES